MVDTHGSVVTVVPFSLHSAVLQLKKSTFCSEDLSFSKRDTFVTRILQKWWYRYTQSGAYLYTSAPFVIKSMHGVTKGCTVIEQTSERWNVRLCMPAVQNIGTFFCTVTIFLKVSANTDYRVTNCWQPWHSPDIQPLTWVGKNSVSTVAKKKTTKRIREEEIKHLFLGFNTLSVIPFLTISSGM